MPGFSSLVPNNEQVSEAMASGSPSIFDTNPTYYTGRPALRNPWQFLFQSGRMADPAEPFLRLSPQGGPSYEPMYSAPVPATPPPMAPPPTNDATPWQPRSRPR
jgi:hypothetical protein